MDTDNPSKAAPEQGSPSSANPPGDRQLALLWRRHRQWSLLSAAVKRRLTRWRLLNLLLLVLGALMGALAAQSWLNADAAQGFAIVAALALAFAGVIQVNALAGGQTARWTMARAAAEALRAESYRYLVRVSPYAGPDRIDVLKARLDLVQNRARVLLVEQEAMTPDDRPLPTVQSIAEYVTGRAEQQANWHRVQSARHLRQARSLRIWQLTATVSGVVLSAIAVFVPSWGLSTWTAAATTIAGAFGAHLAAMQHQGIAAGYAATADQLERLIAGIDPTSATAEQQAEFVVDVERVLAAQNQGWMDLLGSPSQPATEDPPTQDGE